MYITNIRLNIMIADGGIFVVRMKQEATERKRGLKLMEKLDEIKGQERDKIKQGKKPFYLKKSAVKSIELEERYVYIHCLLINTY